MKRLEDFSEHLGRAPDVWNPTSDACLVETTPKLEDRI